MSTPPNILLADDDEEFTALLAEYLEGHGFTVRAVHDGDAAVTQADTADAMVLDVMMPGRDGLDVLRALRAAQCQTPVLMLTARGDDVDRIVGLELGADDYLAKPANPRELAARLHAILRRARHDATPSTYQAGADAASAERSVGPFTIHPHRREVWRGDAPAGLTGMEFDVFTVLADAAGSVVSKDHISRTAMGRRLQPLDRSIDVHVSNLRAKLGPDTIKTVRGRGYQLVV